MTAATRHTIENRKSINRKFHQLPTEMNGIRTDSWAAALSEEQRWALYYKSRGLRWNEAAVWAVKEYGVECPSRSAFYRFLDAMRRDESAHRLEQAKTAALEAAALAKGVALSDAETEEAYKRMAVELALRTGSAREAQRFVEMASTLADRRLRREELRLKGRAQETKDKALRLAREKFEAAERRLAAVEGAVAEEKLTDAERVEKIRSIFGMK